MTSEERKTRLEAWRALVAWLEEHPEVPLLYPLTADNQFLFCHTHAEFLEAHRALGGSAKKIDSTRSGYVILKHDRFAPLGVWLALPKRLTCRQVTRTRVVPMVLAQEAVPEHEETYTQWECPDSILALAETPNEHGQ